MVVKNVAAADAKVAPGFEGGEPLTLANSRGLKSALKFFVKIGLFLEFRRIPGKLGDGDGADAKRAVLLTALFCLFFLEALTLAVAAVWKSTSGTPSSRRRADGVEGTTKFHTGRGAGLARPHEHHRPAGGFDFTRRGAPRGHDAARAAGGAGTGHRRVERLTSPRARKSDCT